MKNINFSDNFAFIYLNKELFDKSVILTSLKAYCEFIDVLMFEEDKYNILKINSKNEDYQVETLAFEFYNYMIGGQFKVINS